MQDTQILSTPPLPTDRARSAGGTAPRRALVFDACQVGVVLRAVLFVEVVMGVGALYGASDPLEWLSTLALLTGGALPATLVWLITACSIAGSICMPDSRESCSGSMPVMSPDIRRRMSSWNSSSGFRSSSATSSPLSQVKGNGIYASRTFPRSPRLGSTPLTPRANDPR